MTESFVQPGVYITTGPQNWQVIQRNADNTADIDLSGIWTADYQSTVEVRVVSELTNRPPSASCDWHDAEATGENSWQATIRNVPAGGPYRIETRLRKHNDPWRLTGDRIHNVAVGDIWILAGQSNSAGYGHGAVEDPPCFCVHMFSPDYVWNLATHPIHDTTRTLHPANRDAGFVDHSPWLAFGRQIYQTTGIPIGLLPTALGGSALSLWDPGADTPILYRNMMEIVAGTGGKAAGMVWYQGESDACPELATTYAERFTRFVETTRRELGHPDMPVLTAQLNRMDGVYDPLKDNWWGVLREAQRQIARTMINVAVLPTLDLTLSDLIHTSSAGNMILAERFSRAALGMAYKQECRGTPSYKAPEFETAVVSADGTEIVLTFSNVLGDFILHSNPAPEFVIEEGGSVVPVIETTASAGKITLKLGKAIGETAIIHGCPTPNPAISITDAEQRPILGFYGVPIERE